MNTIITINEVKSKEVKFIDVPLYSFIKSDIGNIGMKLRKGILYFTASGGGGMPRKTLLTPNFIELYGDELNTPFTIIEKVTINIGE